LSGAQPAPGEHGATGDTHARGGREERLEHVVDVAAHLFAERGFGHVGISELCERLAIGRGQLYDLIGSKEHLLTLIQERFAEIVLAEAKRIEALELPPAERLRELLRHLFTMVATRRDYVRVFLLEGRALNDENRVRHLEQRRSYQQVFEDALVAGVDDGSFDIDHTRLSVVAIVGMASFAHEWLRAGPLPPDDVADVVFDMVLNGISAG
jgi:AcrR family transcriptional regulator